MVPNRATHHKCIGNNTLLEVIIRSSEKFCYDFILNSKPSIINNQIKPHSIINSLIKIVLFE